MLDRINVCQIVKKHLYTLRNERTKKMSCGDILLFLILPLGIASVLCFLNFFLEKDDVRILIMSLAILCGFMFNLLAIIFAFKGKIEEDAKKSQKEGKVNLKKKFVDEIHVNISFNVFIAILCIVFLPFTMCETPIIKLIFNGISYFLIVLFLFTVLMILKRIFILLDK